MHDPNYIKRVLEDYEKKKVLNVLSNALTYPTTAKLKRECVAVYTARYRRKYDGKALQEFFEIGEEDCDRVVSTINRIDNDDFKPLVNFLKGQTKKTDDKNIELLAWLIDFQPRPWQYGVDYSKVEIIAGAAVTAEEDQQLNDVDLRDVEPVNEFDETGDDSFTEELEVEDGIEMESSEENTEKGGKETEVGIENDRMKDDSIVMDGGKEKKEITSLEIVVSMLAKVPKWLSLAILLILLSSGTMLYMQVNNEKGSNVMGSSLNHNGGSGFMYWNGEQYKQINYIPMPDTVVTRLDVNKLKGFKKITRLNTLTEKDIDKLWYHRVSNTEIECFTSHGYHPVEDDKPLKKLTKYMFYKYVYGRY